MAANFFCEPVDYVIELLRIVSHKSCSPCLSCQSLKHLATALLLTASEKADGIDNRRVRLSEIVKQAGGG